MKKKHTLPGNLAFMFKAAWASAKSLIPYTILHIPVIVLIPLVAAYLTRTVVSLVSNGAEVSRLIIEVGGLALGLAVLNVLNMACTRKIKVKGVFVRFSFIVANTVKTMDADYANIEGPEAQQMLNKCEEAVGYTNGSMTQQIFRVIVALFANVAGIIIYSGLIFSLSPWIVVVLAVLGTTNFFVVRKNLLWWTRSRAKWMDIDRKRKFLSERVCDFEAAKDVRLYKMMRWFQPVGLSIMDETVSWKVKEAKRDFGVDASSAAINAIKDGIAYTLLLVQVVRGQLGVAEFVFYFSLITQYSAWIFGVFTAFAELSRSQIQFNDLREFLELPDSTNRGSGAGIPQSAPTIAFENVSYRYAGASADTIQNVSFTIRAGEKIALVGLNGAGKTTIVKLLCNMYKPTTGRITIDGKPIDAYNRDELWKIYSVVFQDVHLMPMSIADNITLCPQDKVDSRKLGRALELSDLQYKIDSLPKKENTMLVKQVHQDGIELSGGEKQRLALARALYKGGSIIILDEPTAALDPIAEARQYERYATLTAGCTSLYISHRLSSTKFCDRVLFLEDGKITEEGTHETLMKQGGKYAQLFDIQSHYYREGVEVS